MESITVLILSFNSSNYIEETLNSFLNQKKFSNFQILISDDCSLDNTKEIIYKYCKNYPNKISAIFNRKNLGIAGNMYGAIEKIKSKYFTLLAADDLIIDEFYLRDSYKIMEEKSDISMTYTNGYSFEEMNTSKRKKHLPIIENNIFNIYEWMRNDFFLINIQGMLIRRSHLPKIFKPWMHNCEQEDWLLLILLFLNNGKFYFQQNKFSTLYRIHSKNYTNSGNKIKKIQGSIILHKNLREYTNYEFIEYFGRNFSWQNEQLACYYLFQRKYINFIKHSTLYFTYKCSFKNRIKFIKTVIKIVLLKYEPKF